MVHEGIYLNLPNSVMNVLVQRALVVSLRASNFMNILAFSSAVSTTASAGVASTGIFLAS